MELSHCAQVSVIFACFRHSKSQVEVWVTVGYSFRSQDFSEVYISFRSLIFLHKLLFEVYADNIIII